MLLTVYWSVISVHWVRLHAHAWSRSQTCWNIPKRHFTVLASSTLCVLLFRWHRNNSSLKKVQRRVCQPTPFIPRRCPLLQRQTKTTEPASTWTATRCRSIINKAVLPFFSRIWVGRPITRSRPACACFACRASVASQISRHVYF